MSYPGLESLKIKAKLLQKAKKKAGKPILLKEALEKIATQSGYKSWRELKSNFEMTTHFMIPGASAYWKTWYADYDQAKKHLKESKGYLLPYRKQFFICDVHYIEALGIDSESPLLKAVGRNWVEPKDLKAWSRLIQKISAPKK